MVEIVTSPEQQSSSTNVLTKEDLRSQEQRRKRKIRKLDFEER